MNPIMREFVHLDDDKSRYKCTTSHNIEAGMCNSSLTFLIRGMRRLQNEDSLCEKKKSCRIEERMRGKEHQRGEEDAGPDMGYEED